MWIYVYMYMNDPGAVCIYIYMCVYIHTYIMIDHQPVVYWLYVSQVGLFSAHFRF